MLAHKNLAKFFFFVFSFFGVVSLCTFTACLVARWLSPHSLLPHVNAQWHVQDRIKKVTAPRHSTLAMPRHVGTHACPHGTFAPCPGTLALRAAQRPNKVAGTAAPRPGTLARTAALRPGMLQARRPHAQEHWHNGPTRWQARLPHAQARWHRRQPNAQACCTHGCPMPRHVAVHGCPSPRHVGTAPNTVAGTAAPRPGT